MLEEPKIKPTTTPCKSFEAQDTCNSERTGEENSSERLKVVVVGHVDHGKSTLLGRWLIDAGKVADDQVHKVERICAEKGVPFEPAFLLDAFEEEQSQGISIDSTRAQLEYKGQKFLLIDVPGHHEFIKNMTSGASNADIGILMIDAAEGIRRQTSGHLKILSILGVRDVVVAINKMDKIGYDGGAFQQLEEKAIELLQSLELHCIAVIPVSALTGENITRGTEKMPWYRGETLLDSIATGIEKRRKVKQTEQFRMLLQDVYKFDDERYFAGRIASGSIAPGKLVYFSPSGKSSRIRAIAKFPDMNVQYAAKDESIAITLEEQVFVERGEVISHPDQAPEVSSEFESTIIWLSEEPLAFDTPYIFKLGVASTTCTISPAKSEADNSEPITNGSLLEVVIKTAQPVAFDRLGDNCLNKFVICSPYDTVGAGIIHVEQVVTRSAVKHLVQVEAGYIERSAKEKAQGHKAAVLWLTGLSGAGKSTLAKNLERALFEKNARVMVLDADTVRTGLCVDLGFTPEDRSENIRRIAEVAKLCLDGGSIVVVACLSPYRKDRELARKIIGDRNFFEIFVSCPIDICQSRDPKGLYRKVAQGQLKSLSGIDSPYQPPSEPRLVLDSSKLSLQQEVENVMAMLKKNSIIGID